MDGHDRMTRHAGPSPGGPDNLGGRDIPAGHVWRAQGVARALGVSFTEAVLDRRLAPAELERLFETCSGCAAPGACIRWLDRHGDAATAAPDFCRNRDLLAALAAPAGETQNRV